MDMRVEEEYFQVASKARHEHRTLGFHLRYSSYFPSILNVIINSNILINFSTPIEKIE